MPIRSGTKKPRARYSAATIAMMARTLDPRLVPAARPQAATGSAPEAAASIAIPATGAGVIDSDRISPVDDPDQDDHDRDYQQDVDEPAHGVGRDESEGP